MSEPILSVRDLRTYFNTPQGVARAVDGVSFDVRPGETLAIVGESGCGKSVTSLSIMGLLPRPAAFHPGGEILFQGQNLLAMKERELRRLRGAQMAMIFQEPMTSLNPVYTVGNQIMESIQLHLGLQGQEARDLAIEMLYLVEAKSAAMEESRRLNRKLEGARSAAEEQALTDALTGLRNRRAMEEALERLMRGRTSIVIAHRLATVLRADRIVVLEAGRVVQSGRHADLVAQGGLYARLARLQFRDDVLAA